MYNYKSYTKAQLIELINIIENTLSTARGNADKAAREYSEEIDARRSFEVGYLGGYINQTLTLISDYKRNG